MKKKKRKERKLNIFNLKKRVDLYMRISLHFCRSIKKLSLKYQVGWSCEYFSKVHFLIINISFNCHLSCLFCWLKPSELLQFVIYQSTFPNIVFLSCLNICILLKVFKTDFKNINGKLYFKSYIYRCLLEKD